MGLNLPIMIGTTRQEATVSLSKTRISRVRNDTKTMLNGFYAFAVLRVKLFRDQQAITTERHGEFLRFFSDNKDRILKFPLLTTADVQKLNELLDVYAHVAASFVPDADMWSRLLNEGMTARSGEQGLVAVSRRRSNPVDNGTKGEGRS